MSEAVFFLISAVFPLSLAYIIEASYSVVACSLCMYQRIVFFLIVIMSATMYKVRHKGMCSVLLILVLLAFASNMIIALYHIGVENGIFSARCNTGKILDDASVYDQLLYSGFASCADKFILFGLSLPTWNLVYSVGVVFGYFFLKRYKNGIFFKK